MRSCWFGSGLLTAVGDCWRVGVGRGCPGCRGCVGFCGRGSSPLRCRAGSWGRLGGGGGVGVWGGFVAGGGGWRRALWAGRCCPCGGEECVGGGLGSVAGWWSARCGGCQRGLGGGCCLLFAPPPRGRAGCWRLAGLLVLPRGRGGKRREAGRSVRVGGWTGIRGVGCVGCPTAGARGTCGRWMRGLGCGVGGRWVGCFGCLTAGARWACGGLVQGWGCGARGRWVGCVGCLSVGAGGASGWTEPGLGCGAGGSCGWRVAPCGVARPARLGEVWSAPLEAALALSIIPCLSLKLLHRSRACVLACLSL